MSSAPSLNWKEIELVLSELDLPGLFVRDINQPDQHTLLVEVAGRGRSVRLLVRLAPPLVRIHATARGSSADPAEPRKPGAAPKRFAAFLRAHIRGGRIVEATQVGRERVVRLSIHRADASTVLWVRLWSNAANAILTETEGRILDVFYRRPKRGEVTGLTFTPPAPGPQLREYAVRELPGEGSFNERLDRAAREADRETGTHAAVEAALRALLDHEAALARRVEADEARIAENSGFDRLKEQGDLILANLGLAAKGDRWLVLGDSRIELDGSLTPSQNAQEYFGRFKRARATVIRLKADLAETLAELSRLRAAVASAQTAGGLDPAALRGVLKQLGIEPGGAPKQAPPGRASKQTAPGLRFRSGSFVLLVGRSATENDELLRRHVRGNDSWFHCRDFPGAYVFVRALPGKSIPLEVMLDAANLAIHYSKAKSSGVADVYYTAVKYLRRPREGPIGLVLPTMEKNLRVRYEPGRIDRLKAET